MGVIAAIVRVILKLPRILWKWATPRNGWKQVVTSSSVGLVTIPKELAITIDEVEHLQKKKKTLSDGPNLPLFLVWEEKCGACPVVLCSQAAVDGGGWGTPGGLWHTEGWQLWGPPDGDFPRAGEGVCLGVTFPQSRSVEVAAAGREQRGKEENKMKKKEGGRGWEDHTTL